MARTVTIRGVELTSLGTWAASTGMVKITPQDAADALAAAADPEVDHAAVKIGHVDPRNDGEPALGWVENLRLSPDKRTILGDLVDVPASLGEPDPTTGKSLMSTAYRRRSVELAWGVRTPSGKTYRMVITGLALLGVTPPAVKGLADVAALYTEPRRTAASSTVAASSSSLLIGEVDAVELDQARQAVAALAATAGAPPASLAAITEALDGLAGANLAGIHQPEPDNGQDGGVPVNEQRIRELLGVEAGVDLEQAINSLKAQAAATPPPAGEATPPATAPPAATPPATAPAAPAAPAAGTPAAEAAPPAGDLVGAGALSAGSLPPGTVLLSAQQWEGIDALIKSTSEGRRTKLVDDAVRAGKIAPAERATYLAAMAENEATTSTILNSLVGGKFPTSELGADYSALGGGGALEHAGDEAMWAEFGSSIGVPGLGAVQTPPAGNAGQQ